MMKTNTISGFVNSPEGNKKWSTDQHTPPIATGIVLRHALGPCGSIAVLFATQLLLVSEEIQTKLWCALYLLHIVYNGEHVL